ncbi:MAG: SUF system NifU family Fe-S cluster assembly protein [Planctomycetes bacterium]|nr:SUF system NifU family Fe-S cluster assembly protein [Planctomycetota bacterium]
MSDELDDLYQEMILDHYRNPRNAGTLPDATGVARGDNPLCGDKIELFVRVKGGVIEDVRFRGSGCAISTAAASLMTSVVKGKSREEAEAIFGKYHGMVTTGQGGGDLGKLAVFAGVSEFPVRVKCATLAWHTLRAAIDGKRETVSTE